jgi:hypothetical protein
MNADRLEPAVIARLDLNPESQSQDEEYQPFLSQVPKGQTVYEYLVACWKRLNSSKTVLLRKVTNRAIQQSGVYSHLTGLPASRCTESDAGD